MRWILLAAAAMALLGCQQSPYEVAPVRGRVTIGDRPLVGGKVMFAPVAKENATAAGKAAFGRTRSDGSFTLTTYRDGDGAVVGDHWVTLFVPERAAQNVTPITDTSIDNLKYKRVPVRQKQVVVAGQENEINIAL